MKRFFIIAFVLVATTATMNSYGKAKKGKITTKTDSLAYAIGIDMASGVFQFDSTHNLNFNLKFIANAFKDVYAQKAGMTMEESGDYIQKYMTVKIPLKDAEESRKFIKKAIKNGANTLASGLAYKIKKEGSDRKVALGDSIYVNYAVILPNGKEIYKTSEPTSLLLQSGQQIIKGCIEGIQLVGEGGKITLFIPDDLAYEFSGRLGGGVRPNQAVKFEIEVVKVVTSSAFALIATTTTVSSDGKGKAKKKSKITMDTDSLAYAIGINMATRAFQFDSTHNLNFNMKFITNAFKDVYAQKAGMTMEESGDYIQKYMTVEIPLKNAAEARGFIEDAIKDGADTLASGLAYKIVEKGSDRKVALGDTIYVNYVMTLPSGKEVDKSPETVPFSLEKGMLIDAWIEGVPLVGEGGKIILFIPSKLAYGERGLGSIVGPNQAIKFEIEVVKVVAPSAVSVIDTESLPVDDNEYSSEDIDCACGDYEEE